MTPVMTILSANTFAINETKKVYTVELNMYSGTLQEKHFICVIENQWGV